MTQSLNKILEQFNKLNSQARFGIFAGVVFLIILLDVFLVAWPQVASIMDLHHQLKKMAEDTQQVLTDRQRIKQLRANLQTARTALNDLNDKIRPVSEVPVILDTISSVANEYGVKIDQLVPQKNQQEALTKSGDPKYYSLPIIIKARCGYHMFGHFLNKLEDSQMFFIMKNFVIESNEKDPQAHSFYLTISVILFDHNGTQSKSL